MQSILNIFFSGFLIGVFLSAPMGPVGMLVIQRTLSKGRIAALLTGCGAMLSDLFYCLLTAMGMSMIIDPLQEHQYLLQIIGSVALIIYGVYLFCSKSSRAIALPRESKSTYWRDFVSGFLFTVSNPLILILIISLFARFSFVDSTSQFYYLVLGYVGIAVGAFTWWYIITYSINKIRNHFNVRSIWILNRIIASILMTMAVIGLINGICNVL